MSQGSQGPFAANRTILPLLKFSYATVHNESITPIPWIHLGRTNDNLFAIFESQSVEDGRGQAGDLRMLKVLQDPDVLEEIDLHVLASEAMRARTEAQNPRMSGRVPSVTVVVQVPCIAVRYPLEGGQIRRIQLRLTNNDDYYETLKILTRAGVPFADAGSFPSQRPLVRPFSSSSSLLRPNDSASQVGAQPIPVPANVGGLPSVSTGSSAGWASATSVRPTISSRPVCGSSSGTLSSFLNQPGRNPEMSKASRTSIMDTPTPSNPPSGFVSQYFAGQHQVHGTYPAPRSALGHWSIPNPIDLYQPRPSTAPIIGSQLTNQMLPPKRELPFSYLAPTKKIKKDSARSKEEQAGANAAAKTKLQFSMTDPGKLSCSSLEVVSAMKSTSEVSPKSSAAISTIEEKQMVNSKAPRPRATKKQQAKVLAKKRSKSATEQDSIPSVEQLLIETSDCSKETVVTSAAIDTQALLARVEATKSCQLIKRPDVFEVADVQPQVSAPSSQARKCNNCRSRKGKCNGQDPCDWCIDVNVNCLYDDSIRKDTQVLVPPLQSKNTSEITKKPSVVRDDKTAPSRPFTPENDATASESANRKMCMPKHSVVQKDSPSARTPQAQTLDPDVTLIDAASATSNADKTSALTNVHRPADVNAQAVLLREAAFARSNQLTSWADLPESVQNSTLDTWMCQQLDDPGFIALVKRLDESWQANLFGKSVGVDI